MFIKNLCIGGTMRNDERGENHEREEELGGVRKYLKW